MNCYFLKIKIEWAVALILLLTVLNISLAQDSQSLLPEENQFRSGVLLLEVICGTPLNLDSHLTPNDLLKGYLDFLGKTKLRVRCTNSSWTVVSQVKIIALPEGVKDPGPDILKVKNNDSGAWIAGGGIVQTGTATKLTGIIFPVHFRFDLTLLESYRGYSTIGYYTFSLTYKLVKIEDSI